MSSRSIGRAGAGSSAGAPSARSSSAAKRAAPSSATDHASSRSVASPNQPLSVATTTSAPQQPITPTAVVTSAQVAGASSSSSSLIPSSPSTVPDHPPVLEYKEAKGGSDPLRRLLFQSEHHPIFFNMVQIRNLHRGSGHFFLPAKVHARVEEVAKATSAEAQSVAHRSLYDGTAHNLTVKNAFHAWASSRQGITGKQKQQPATREASPPSLPTAAPSEMRDLIQPSIVLSKGEAPSWDLYELPFIQGVFARVMASYVGEPTLVSSSVDEGGVVQHHPPSPPVKDISDLVRVCDWIHYTAEKKFIEKVDLAELLPQVIFGSQPAAEEIASSPSRELFIASRLFIAYVRYLDNTNKSFANSLQANSGSKGAPSRYGSLCFISDDGDDDNSMGEQVVTATAATTSTAATRRQQFDFGPDVFCLAQSEPWHRAFSELSGFFMSPGDRFPSFCVASDGYTTFSKIAAAMNDEFNPLVYLASVNAPSMGMLVTRRQYETVIMPSLQSIVAIHAASSSTTDGTPSATTRPLEHRVTVYVAPIDPSHASDDCTYISGNAAAVYGDFLRSVLHGMIGAPTASPLSTLPFSAQGSYIYSPCPFGGLVGTMLPLAKNQLWTPYKHVLRSETTSATEHRSAPPASVPWHSAEIFSILI